MSGGSRPFGRLRDRAAQSGYPSQPVIGLGLVSHGELAPVLLDTASEIVGPIEPAIAIAIHRHQSCEDVEAIIRDAVERVDRGAGVLILADMFGGTASNVSLRLLGAHEVEVVTGVNLPMLLKVSSLLEGSDDLAALAQLLKYYGQRNVMVASEVLKERAS